MNSPVPRTLMDTISAAITASGISDGFVAGDDADGNFLWVNTISKAPAGISLQM